MSARHFGAAVACLTLSIVCLSSAADTMSLTPFSCCDGLFKTLLLPGGQAVWQNTNGHIYLYFDVPGGFTFTPGSPVYLKVIFYDQGYGRVGVHYDSTKGDSLADKYREAEEGQGASRLNSGSFVEAYYQLAFPRFAGRQNGGADFRLYLADGGSTPLSVKSATIQDHPFKIEQLNQVNLIPFSCCDGQFQPATVGSQSVWRTLAGNSYMYFAIPGTWGFPLGASVYLKVTYYDEGHGTVWVEYDSTAGNTLADMYRRSETHTRSSRVNTRTFVDSYHELLLPKLAGRQNGGADFRLALADGGIVPLSVKAVTISNAPSEDPQFQYVLTKPWLRPYTGPTRDYVDRSTLNHKVMVGYQGWFRTPNDLADQGWVHWCRDGVMIPANFTVDMWPDRTDFDPNELFRAGDVVTRSGQPAHLFSSATRATVRRHFQWMRKYNIDGAFLQRFVHSSSSGAWGRDEWVLHHVREAANLEGRIWAIEYDVSALSSEPDPYEVITTDWNWLVDVAKVLEDPRYAHEGTQPVVFVWGLPYPDRHIDMTTANAIIDFFKFDARYGGNYVIGGLPWWWRTMGDWHDHIRRYDAALAWMPPDRNAYLNDYSQLRSWGIDYFPHVWPGFSWANLQHQTGTQDYWPRAGGEFFWNKLGEATGSGATRLFIGMFDEYDEGTAIMPMSDDPPNPSATWGRFITNEGRPSDWWMVLAGEARDILLRHQWYSFLLPNEQTLANRSNVGPEAWIDLGAVDASNQLSWMTVAQGQTQAVSFAGRDCRCNAAPGLDLYLAFDVDSGFAFEESQGLDVTAEVEYHDSPPFLGLSLDYDGINGPHTQHPLTITTQGSGEWRTVRFEITDAYFGNRQDGGSDFRLVLPAFARFYIDHVWVRTEQSPVP